MQYKLVTGSSDVIRTSADSVVSFVPADPANRDWQEYQAWLVAGNTPEPADS